MTIDEDAATVERGLLQGIDNVDLLLGRGSVMEAKDRLVAAAREAQRLNQELQNALTAAGKDGAALLAARLEVAREVEVLKDGRMAYAEMLDRRQAENKRLREAVEAARRFVAGSHGPEQHVLDKNDMYRRLAEAVRAASEPIHEEPE